MRQESKYKVLWEIALTKPSSTGCCCLTSVCFVFFVSESCFCFRYRIEYEALSKVESEQNEFIDQFILQKWWHDSATQQPVSRVPVPVQFLLLQPLFWSCQQTPALKRNAHTHHLLTPLISDMVVCETDSCWLKQLQQPRDFQKRSAGIPSEHSVHINWIGVHDHFKGDGSIYMQKQYL